MTANQNIPARYIGRLDGSALDNAREWLADIGYHKAARASATVVAYYTDQLYDGGLDAYVSDHAAWVGR
jgi:hypothetical protein